MTPISSVKPMLTGEMAAPPAVSVVRDVAMGIGTADLYKIYRAVNDAGEAFIPVVPSLAKTFIGMSSWANSTERPKGTLFNQLMETMGEDGPDKPVRDFAKELKESIVP